MAEPPGDGLLGGILSGAVGGGASGGGGIVGGSIIGGKAAGGSEGVSNGPTSSGFTGLDDKYKNQAIADFLEENCDCSVRNNPSEGTNGNGDALVDGYNVEFKTLDPGAKYTTIKSRVSESLSARDGLGQGRDIVIDARKSGLSRAEAERRVARALGAARGKLDSITIIGDDYFFTRP